MFDLTKLWDRWISDGQQTERPTRDDDYSGRTEPPISGEAWETATGPNAAPATLSPEDTLPDATQWIPPLLTV